MRRQQGVARIAPVVVGAAALWPQEEAGAESCPQAVLPGAAASWPQELGVSGTCWPQLLAGAAFCPHAAAGAVVSVCSMVLIELTVRSSCPRAGGRAGPPRRVIHI